MLRAPALLASLVVTGVVLAANAAFLLGVRSNNPMLYYSGLGSPSRGTVKPITYYTIDANDGWVVQSLGRLAARSWLSGDVPLWNHYEGLGQPLAGEMQSAAMFLPFTLLHLLPHGIVLMHVALELVAGFGTLVFLRSLRLTWAAATCGACLFALNGAFSVMTNAPFNPIAFLPVALWGIEFVAGAAVRGDRSRLGTWVLALAFAFMLYAGFPETALLEGLFVAAWAVARLVRLSAHRRLFVVWTGVGVLAGVVLAAPVLVAFVDFLGFASVAYHAGAANDYSYPLLQVTSLGLPYAVGPLGNAVSHTQAGYLTLPAVLVALVGLRGRRVRVVKVALGLILAVLVLNMFGFAPVKVVLGVVPGIRNTLVAKYGLVLIEFAVAICAAFGIDDLRRSRVRGRSILLAAATVGCYLAGSWVTLARQDLFIRPRWTAIMLGLTVGACVLVSLVLVWSRLDLRRARLLAAICAAVVVGYAAGIFAVPQLSASPPGPVDLGPVRFLQAHLGTSRFYTLGPIQPNYGSYWGIAQLNANDLPVPAKYARFVMDDLRPASGTPGSDGTARSFKDYQLVPFNPGAKEQRALLLAYGQQQSAFQEAAAKYVVMRRGVSGADTAAKYGLTRVYQDAKVEIWQDPKAAPYWSPSGGCHVLEESVTDVRLDCPGAATLIRRELSAPGWTVTVNGTRRTVADGPDQLFQSVQVSAGVSNLSFSYAPRFFAASAVLALLMLAVMLGDGLLELRRRHTSSSRPALPQPAR